MFLALLIAAAPLSTPEIFTVAQSDVEGPCLRRIPKDAGTEPNPECAAIIERAGTAKEKAIFNFAWGWTLIESGKTLEALPWLDRAIDLAPNFTNARHERAYLLGDLGLYRKALIDADRNIELTPSSAAAYSERSFIRHRLTDFSGSLADLRKAEELGEVLPYAIANDLMWLGRYDEALQTLRKAQSNDDVQQLRAELNRRIAFKPDGKEADRCRMEKAVGDQAEAQSIVDACTILFDRERDPANRAKLLVTRAVYSVVAKQDRRAAIDDFRTAIGLEPTNPDHWLNYGYALVGIGRSWAGRNALDEALKSSKLTDVGKGIALAGRGHANLNLRNFGAAKADAEASLALGVTSANSGLAGDIAHAEGRFADARSYWLTAYKLGSRDDSLIASLKSVGVSEPEKEITQ